VTEDYSQAHRLCKCGHIGYHHRPQCLFWWRSSEGNKECACTTFEEVEE